MQIGQRFGGCGVERHFILALFDEAGELLQRAEILDQGEAKLRVAGIDFRGAEAVLVQPAANCGERLDAGCGEAGLLVPPASQPLGIGHGGRAGVILDGRRVHQERGLVAACQPGIAARRGVLAEPVNRRIAPALTGQERFDLQQPVCVKSHGGEPASLRRKLPASLCDHPRFVRG